MKTNKFLATLLVFALVVTLVAPSLAFAAAPTDDVTDAAQVAAITKLNALGVLEGDGDGKFRPADSLTRAEFAKIAVAISGNAALAERFAGSSSFTDVPTNSWYAGWVEAAYASGYVLGVGDGKFAPESKITNAQAVTVLMRILGYKDDKLAGTWPNNFIVKANSIGLLVDGLGANDAPISRGIMAVLSSEATNKKLVKYDKDGNEENVLVGGVEVTLLEDKFNEVTETLRLSEIKEKALSFVGEGDKNLAKGFDKTGINALLGHKVTVVVNDDNEVVAIADAQKANEMVTGKITTAWAATGVVEVAGTERSISSSAIAYYNGVKGSASAANLPKDATVTLFYSDTNKSKGNDAVFAVAEKFTTDLYVSEKPGATNSEGVTSIKYKNAAGTPNTLKVTKSTAITINGNAATVADLQKNIVFDVIIKSGEALTIKAYDKTVTGKVSKIVTKDDKQIATIDGSTYEAVAKVVAKSGMEKDLTAGNTYTLYLNGSGKFVHFAEDEGTASEFWGLLVAVENYIGTNKDGKQVFMQDATIVNKDGEKVVVETKANVAPSDTSFANALTVKDSANALTSANVGQVYKFNLKDGKLEKVTTATAATPAALGAHGVVVTKDIKADAKVIDVDGTNFAIASGVVVYDLTDSKQLKKYATTTAGIDISKVKADDVKVVALTDVLKDAKVALYKSKDLVDYIVMYDSGKASESALSPVYGIFKNYYTLKEDGKDPVYYATINVDGADVDVKLASDKLGTYKRGQALAFADKDENGSYEINKTPVTGGATVTGTVYDKHILVGGSKYLTTADTKYYKVKVKNATFGVVGDLNPATEWTNANVSIVSAVANDPDGAQFAIVTLVDKKGDPITATGYAGIAELVVIYETAN